MGGSARGQVLVLFALLLVILLGFAALAIDLGRQVAERRHLQTAADAGALAACRELINGSSDAAASAAARTVAMANVERSPAGATAVIAPDTGRAYEDGHAGDPAHLRSGILVAGGTVRIAISSTLETTVGRVLGITQLETGARARCDMKGTPAVPLVVRRYANPPGPGSGFVDVVASAATSGSGQVDATNPRGYGGRTPASDLQPGPVFQLYGPDSKATNEASFRGFIALDVRNFETIGSRVYYNGVVPGTGENTLKDLQGSYLVTGYPGPSFPTVSTPPTGDTQVAILSGHDTPMIVGNFSQAFTAADRVLLAVYDGTVMEIPDFSITPPPLITLPATGTVATGPTFTVSRNPSFFSTVELHLHGDADASDPAHSILPSPSVTPPASGTMTEPTWSIGTAPFTPGRQGTQVTMLNMTTNAVRPGYYTVWLEGHSGNPYYQTRRVPVPVRVNGTGPPGTPDGPATRDFSLGNSVSRGLAPALGGTITLPIYVSTTSAASTQWGSAGSPVALSWDQASFATCTLTPQSLPSPSQVSLSASSVTPSASGSGALSNLTINTAGLGPGCYTFNLRATGTNGDGQPVTHLLPVTFTVGTATGTGQYVDIIGFAVFEIQSVGSNAITARAVSVISADPNDPALRRAQRPRLVPWS